MEQFEICYTIPISDARCGGLVLLAGLVGENMHAAYEFFEGVLNIVGSVNEEVRVTSGILLTPVNDDLKALLVECMRAV